MAPEKQPPKSMLATLEEQLQTVYDPEFPVIDIWTLGLFYDVTIIEEQRTVAIIMTFTTPACPMGEMIEQMVENAIHDVYPDRHVHISVTFDPMWSPTMIKDEDLQRMFE